jgi:HAE1 family hydrophobic/amphiphilic exporter-1
MVHEPDKGQLYVKLEYPTGFNLAETQRAMAAVEQRLSTLPHLRHRLSTIGKVEGTIGKVSEGVYLAQIFLRFTDRIERVMTIDELLTETRRRLADVPGAIVAATQPTIVGGQSTAIELEIAGADFAILDRSAQAIAEAGAAVPGLRELDTTVRPGKGELRIHPRRAVLADRDIGARGLGYLLRANIEGLEAGSFKRGDRSYDIRVRLAEQPGLDQVAAFQLPGDTGHPVALESLAEIEQSETPILITRKDKRRIAMVLANLEPGIPLGKGVAALEAAITAQGLLPPGYDHRFSGTYEVMGEAQAAMGEAGLIAMVLVVLTLAAILESFTQPILILVTIPLALMGVILALALVGGSFGIFEMMGMVMLIGIVVNNAILIVDQMNVHRAEGRAAHGAMIDAACERFRPIVMITIAAVLGMLPLAIGSGLGAELRNGVGIAAIGGILISGVLTQLVLPVLYDLFARNRRPPASEGHSSK